MIQVIFDSFEAEHRARVSFPVPSEQSSEETAAIMLNQEPNPGIPVEASCSETAKNVVRLSHTWTIKNFNFFLADKFIDSATFSSQADDGISWNITLYPDGEKDEHKGYVSVFLHLRAPADRGVLANLKISILKADGVVACEEACFKPLTFINGLGIGSPKLMKRDDLLQNRGTYLPDDKLTVVCEVWYTVDGAGASRLTQ